MVVEDNGGQYIYSQTVHSDIRYTLYEFPIQMRINEFHQEYGCDATHKADWKSVEVYTQLTEIHSSIPKDAVKGSVHVRISVIEEQQYDENDPWDCKSNKVVRWFPGKDSITPPIFTEKISDHKIRVHEFVQRNTMLIGQKEGKHQDKAIKPDWILEKPPDKKNNTWTPKNGPQEP